MNSDVRPRLRPQLLKERRVNLRTSFMHQQFFLALGDADDRHGDTTLVTRFDGCC